MGFAFRLDGTWSADVTSGGSSSLTEEQRLEVHNRAGLPATRVDLTLT